MREFPVICWLVTQSSCPVAGAVPKIMQGNGEFPVIRRSSTQSRFPAAGVGTAGFTPAIGDGDVPGPEIIVQKRNRTQQSGNQGILN